MKWSCYVWFTVGILLGLVIGLIPGRPVTKTRYVQVEAETARAHDAYAYGFDVLVGGQVVCRDPFVWYSLKQIECR